MPRILFVSGFHPSTRARDLAYEFERSVPFLLTFGSSSFSFVDSPPFDTPTDLVRSSAATSPRLVTRTLTRTRKLNLSELVLSFALRSRRMSSPETSERAHPSISHETTILRTNADEKRNVSSISRFDARTEPREPLVLHAFDRATVAVLTRALHIRASRYTCDDDPLASLSRYLPFGFPDELSLNHPHLDLNTQLRFRRIPLQPRCRRCILRHVCPYCKSHRPPINHLCSVVGTDAISKETV